MDYLVWGGDPNIFSIGGVTVRWYGLMFAFSFWIGMQVTEQIFKKEGKKVTDVEYLFIYVMVGTVIGARLGHCLFYDPSYYLSNPLKIFAVWEGGLASHGGAIGLITGVYLFCIKYNYNFIWLIDRMVLPSILAGAIIRIGNFFNSEIVGTPTEQPWGVIFLKIDMLPRHPTQLYESFSYFILFGITLWIYTKYFNKLKTGFLFGFYLISIFSVRFMLEFVKVKQANYDNILGMTTGQFLSIPFIALGIYMMFFYKSKDV
ncbi:Prolipoprotein diacylglyceryl transferase [hydrothermal vent metagenome]|uniref:Prolipoprotein diacylglyceryl transferase n=1 Tax=hydrothermal vent metagenome TaxID=652676 RepID=A0A1W1BW22_9ZZZZ